MTLPKLLAIVGPTASGKSALALEIAKDIGGEVLCVDSRTVYKGMDIGTAKPMGEWREMPIERGGIGQLFGARHYLDVEGIPHWGLDLVNPDEEYGPSAFKTYAMDRIREIFARGRVPMLCGGTGLWVRAIAENLSFADVPPNPAVRAELEVRTLDDLFAEYKRLDPEGAEAIDRHNKRRVVRALEVTRVTGRPFSKQAVPGEALFETLQIAPDLSREQLNERIDTRVDIMIAQGLVNEVRRLHTQYGSSAPGMSAIGYRELTYFLEGKAPLAAAIEEIKRNTRSYAKRQETWFRKYGNVHWVKGVPEAVDLVRAFLR